MLPVKIFKKTQLRSVSEEDIFKTMTSSGTTGQQVSKIFLNRQTANNQQKVLTRIVSDFTGHSRMPMIILDCPSVLKNRNMFSARGAGILGFSLFGSKKVYAFNDEMELNLFELNQFLEKDVFIWSVNADIFMPYFFGMIIRNMQDFSVCRHGEEGVIQVLSALPESYPGHSLLTEDVGCILGEDDCPCGRKGKYIEIYGRMKNAEVRGCSDTFEQ